MRAWFSAGVYFSVVALVGISVVSSVSNNYQYSEIRMPTKKCSLPYLYHESVDIVA
jgi:hypothetical protein